MCVVKFTFSLFYPYEWQEKGAVAIEDSKSLFKVKYDLRNVTKGYCMEFYFQIDDNGIGSQQGI